MTQQRVVWTVIAACVSGMVAGFTATDADAQTRRPIIIRNGKVFRGSSPHRFWSVFQSHAFRPQATDEEIIKTFIKVSVSGATGLAFDLAGFNEDGTELDSAQVAAVHRTRGEGDYRWMPSICRVFGAYPHADADFRRNAVRTAATAFKNYRTMLYWIDGPDAARLVKAFKEIAPDLAVLAPEGGDIRLIQSLAEMDESGVPVMVKDAVPEFDDWDIHCVLPQSESSLETLERVSRLPAELKPWTPTTYGLTEQEKKEGFVALFDGESFDGWSITGPNQEGFIVEDGAIHWNGRGGRSVQFRDRFDDFVLRLEWRILRINGNSGIFLRAPRANRSSKMGFEFQIMGDYGKPPDTHSTGSIYSVAAPRVNASNPVGEWNELEIRLEGPQFRATLNGQVIQDMNFDEHEEMKYRLRRGFIALQDHSNPVSFRNIRIKEL